MLTRDGPVRLKSDDVKQLNWASRNPNYGEMMASGLITLHHHLCISIYTFRFFSLEKWWNLWNFVGNFVSPNFTALLGFQTLFSSMFN